MNPPKGPLKGAVGGKHLEDALVSTYLWSRAGPYHPQPRSGTFLYRRIQRRHLPAALRPREHRSSGRAVVVNLRCAASRRALGGTCSKAGRPGGIVAGLPGAAGAAGAGDRAVAGARERVGLGAGWSRPGCRWWGSRSGSRPRSSAPGRCSRSWPCRRSRDRSPRGRSRRRPGWPGRLGRVYAVSMATVASRTREIPAATLALSFCPMNCGIAMAARMPMMSTTTRSSMRVNPS